MSKPTPSYEYFEPAASTDFGLSYSRHCSSKYWPLQLQYCSKAYKKFYEKITSFKDGLKESW